MQTAKLHHIVKEYRIGDKTKYRARLRADRGRETRPYFPKRGQRLPVKLWMDVDSEEWSLFV